MPMPFYTGIVEDRNDPLEMGRVRVRVFSIHTDSKTDIPTSSLPWAQIMQPTNSAATSGLGYTTLGPVEGTTVLMTFADADMQQPIVMGTLAGNVTPHYKIIDGTPVNRNPQKGFNDPNGIYPDSDYYGETDVHKLARAETQRPDPLIQGRIDSRTTGVSTAIPSSGTWDEPVSGVGSHTYPLNRVRFSETGHLEEWDDTPNNSRIHTKHSSGTFTEIINDGTKTTKIVGDDFSISMKDRNVLVSGNCNVTINGGAKLKVQGNYDVEVNGNHNVTVAGNQTVTVFGNQIFNIGRNQTVSVGANQSISIGASKTEVAPFGLVRYTRGDVIVSRISLVTHRHIDPPGIVGLPTSPPIPGGGGGGGAFGGIAGGIGGLAGAAGGLAGLAGNIPGASGLASAAGNLAGLANPGTGIVGFADAATGGSFGGLTGGLGGLPGLGDVGGFAGGIGGLTGALGSFIPAGDLAAFMGDVAGLSGGLAGVDGFGGLSDSLGGLPGGLTGGLGDGLSGAASGLGGFASQIAGGSTGIVSNIAGNLADISGVASGVSGISNLGFEGLTSNLGDINGLVAGANNAFTGAQFNLANAVNTGEQIAGINSANAFLAGAESNLAGLVSLDDSTPGGLASLGRADELVSAGTAVSNANSALSAVIDRSTRGVATSTLNAATGVLQDARTLQSTAIAAQTTLSI